MCRLQGKIFTAFTLAEILITLAVIGIVAVLTIPGLIKNHNEKAWATAQSVFEKRLEVATKQMNTEEKLAGYSSTMDFVNELKKYIKITRICDNSEITKCFNKQVIWNEGEDPIDMSTIKNAASLGQDDWDTDTVAVQFANGVNAIIAYNPNTTQDPYNNQFSATSSSMAILYDVSGNKKPNTTGKDIAKINVTELAGVTGCMLDPNLVGGMCISRILTPGTGYSSLSKEECEQIADAGYGNKKEWCGGVVYDYWAGAVKACKGIDNMPTLTQLTQLSEYLYDGDIECGILNKEKASLFLENSTYDSGFQIWAATETDDDLANLRTYYSNDVCNPNHGVSANWSYDRGSSGTLAICISN